MLCLLMLLQHVLNYSTIFVLYTLGSDTIHSTPLIEVPFAINMHNLIFDLDCDTCSPLCVGVSLATQNYRKSELLSLLSDLCRKDGSTLAVSFDPSIACDTKAYNERTKVAYVPCFLRDYEML